MLEATPELNPKESASVPPLVGPAEVVLPPALDLSRVLLVCPSLERLDLVRPLYYSFVDTLPEGLSLAARPQFVVSASGRDDGTVGWCQNQGIAVVDSSPAQLTFAQAVNLAVKNLDPQVWDWVLLVNNDIVLQPGFWDGFMEMAALHYDIIGTKLLYPLSVDPKLNPSEKHLIQHYGKWFTLDFYPFHVLRHQPADHPMAQIPRPFPAVTFACAAISKEVWTGLEGLDEGYVNGYEDDDFCLRAREHGAQIGVHPQMLAIHKESQSTGIDTENKAAQWDRFHKIWVDTGRISWPLGMHMGWKFV